MWFDDGRQAPCSTQWNRWTPWQLAPMAWWHLILFGWFPNERAPCLYSLFLFVTKSAVECCKQAKKLRQPGLYVWRTDLANRTQVNQLYRHILSNERDLHRGHEKMPGKSMRNYVSFFGRLSEMLPFIFGKARAFGQGFLTFQWSQYQLLEFRFHASETWSTAGLAQVNLCVTPCQSLLSRYPACHKFPRCHVLKYTEAYMEFQKRTYLSRFASNIL